MTRDETTPVLIGAAQLTDRSNSENGLTPVQIISESMRLALKDTGKAEQLNKFDLVACSGLTVDAKQVNTPVSGLVRNIPFAATKAAGISADKYVYAETGGNTPQMLINHYAKAIARNECESVLIAGGEALHTMNLRFNHWAKFLRPKRHWKDKSGPLPDTIGEPRDGSNDYENLYGMNLPAKVYPLFENALRHHYQHGINEHIDKIATLFSKFSAVAATNQHAWFSNPPSKDEILEQGPRNRMIGFPYRKRLNSMILVNQSAAVVMTSVAKAKAMGIAPEKWVYLHGYADGYEIWNVSQRENYYSSPAIKQLSERALTMAKKAIDDIATFDIYSCFPSAVQVACDAMGIAHDDSRPLTLTGGLPYFGGPGNNYSMHAIAEMVRWARENPNDFGLMNANGWYLTKHSVGIYSQTPPPEAFKEEGPIHQSTDKSPKLNADATGRAKIETYTVLYNKSDEPSKSIVIARNENGERCLATTDNSAEKLRYLTESEGVGLDGELVKSGNKTVFEF